MSLLVLGGSGYVGKSICKYAVSTQLYKVTSMSRTGKIKNSESWVNEVNWTKGDIFQNNDEDHFKEKAAVLSTLGAFGSNDFMEKICGDANIKAMEEARNSGVEYFVFISSSRVGSMDLSPSMPLYGYFHGKLRAEQELTKIFGDKGIILRPGFIYGNRDIGNGMQLPLQLIGSPLSSLALNFGTLSKGIQSVPFFGEELKSFVPVEAVAKTAVDSIQNPKNKTIFMPDDIRKYGGSS